MPSLSRVLIDTLNCADMPGQHANTRTPTFTVWTGMQASCMCQQFVLPEQLDDSHQALESCHECWRWVLWPEVLGMAGCSGRIAWTARGPEQRSGGGCHERRRCLCRGLQPGLQCRPARQHRQTRAWEASGGVSGLSLPRLKPCKQASMR